MVLRTLITFFSLSNTCQLKKVVYPQNVTSRKTLCIPGKTEYFSTKEPMSQNKTSCDTRKIETIILSKRLKLFALNIREL